MDRTVFELKGVHYSYLGRYPALCGVDIKIERGQKISIIGANGSGKSTLLHVLDGLIFPDKGSARFFGKELKEGVFNDQKFSRAFRRAVGFVFQNPDVQLFCPTVKEDIVFGPLQLGMGKKDINKRFEELVNLLGLKDLVDRAPHQLSIGEKRKVAIASSLAIDPDVLVLDEPTAGLDPLTTRHILDMLVRANAAGKTVVVSTHDLHIAEEISDMIYVFDHEKRIIKYGRPDIILNDAQLLHDNNLAHVHSHRHREKLHIHPHTHVDHHPDIG